MPLKNLKGISMKSYKKLIPIIYLKESVAYRDLTCSKKNGNGDAVELACTYSNNGADEIIIMDLSENDAAHEEAIGIIRQIAKAIDTPLLAGGNVNRVEDIKKYLYAGAKIALLDDLRESNMLMMKETADRFGKDKIGLISHAFDNVIYQMAMENELCVNLIMGAESAVRSGYFAGIPSIFFIDTESNDINAFSDVLKKPDVYGITGTALSSADFDFMKAKETLSLSGIHMNTFKSAIPFSEFKLNSDGLIPVIVQDYKTDEVLMLAYMNEESYAATIRTGKMTYYSRSRKELWVKGMTSGHFQYVRSIELDCDNDTLLAKVKQLGAACHTGNRSCFYRNLVSTEYAETNPLKVFNEVMHVIEDRRLHPKQGSYTNYLFDKGIDKILKKCGEEATEIIIAAKNPDPEEIKYEISDFLYHVMVLMVLRGVTWDDIVKELANR